ncbi:hypothetical protein KQ41_20085 [Lysinibacillus fusiformis]|uniref:STM4504/CBY_0614 family protein n=1 Tax=Lysinibacillus fusiformis TaxID=28031 RepID=UPI00050038FD|nr:hypothetical protein [Lysinibacillus fusiformis]KGA81109.1 hypothetical protein KQ41_20085 [Lysinibacillus fusiformis]
MGFFELFSIRNNPKITDVFEYEKIDEKCRIQINHVLTEIIPRNREKFDDIWKSLEFNLCKELGKLKLGDTFNSEQNILYHLLKCKDKEYIDSLDFVVYFINWKMDAIESAYSYWGNRYPRHVIETKINEISYRLRQNSIGYEVLDGQLIRIDNQYVHDEIVKSAVKLLHEKDFRAVSDEFFKAHEHYKEGDYKDAIVSAGRAFESTMKTICSKNGYSYDAERDTANVLIKRLFDNGLIPSYMQNHIQGLRQALENSAHVLRNKNGGHGQGDVIVDVDDSIVRYTLNLCATNIVFLVERYKETK